MIILFFALRHIDLERPNVPSLPDFLRAFDAIGLLLFLSSTVLLVFGFSFAPQYGCTKCHTKFWWTWTNRTAITGTSPVILTVIIAGFLSFILGIFYECKTDREPVFPSVIFTDKVLSAVANPHLMLFTSTDCRYTALTLLVVFFHSFVFNSGTFFLSMYYQVGARLLGFMVLF